MVVARDVKRSIAPRVQKVILDYASPMEVAGAANILNVQRVPKVVPISARHMVEEKGAHTWVAQKELKEAHYFVKHMVEGNAVLFKAVAQRVCMVALSSVLLMVVEKDALYQSALKVQEVGQISVFVMAVERDAKLRVVERALRAALNSVKRMGVVSGVHGANLSQVLVLVALPASVWLEERVAFALHTLLWWMINVFMGKVNFWHLVRRIKESQNLRR